MGLEGTRPYGARMVTPHANLGLGDFASATNGTKGRKGPHVLSGRHVSPSRPVPFVPLVLRHAPQRPIIDRSSDGCAPNGASQAVSNVSGVGLGIPSATRRCPGRSQRRPARALRSGMGFRVGTIGGEVSAKGKCHRRRDICYNRRAPRRRGADIVCELFPEGNHPRTQSLCA